MRSLSHAPFSTIFYSRRRGSNRTCHKSPASADRGRSAPTGSGRRGSGDQVIRDRVAETVGTYVGGRGGGGEARRKSSSWSSRAHQPTRRTVPSVRIIVITIIIFTMHKTVIIIIKSDLYNRFAGTARARPLCVRAPSTARERSRYYYCCTFGRRRRRRRTRVQQVVVAVVDAERESDQKAYTDVGETRGGRAMMTRLRNAREGLDEKT